MILRFLAFSLCFISCFLWAQSPDSSRTSVDNTTSNPPANPALHPSWNMRALHSDAFKPRVSALSNWKDQQLLLASWSAAGSIYLVNLKDSTANRMASGLAEPMGICVLGEEIYVMQKHELTRILDVDGDRVADSYETVCDDWPFDGTDQAYNFGLEHVDGAFYSGISLLMDARGIPLGEQPKGRGELVRIHMDGTMETLFRGVYVPNGLTMVPELGMIITDQNPQVKTAWIMIQDDVQNTLDARRPPVAVWLPRPQWESPSQVVHISDGPYKGQLFIGDLQNKHLSRISLQKVGDQWQGCAIPHSNGFDIGINRMVFDNNGILYAGGADGTLPWGKLAFNRHALYVLNPTGKTVFEIQDVKAWSNGLELQFSEAVNDSDSLSAENIILSQRMFSRDANMKQGPDMSAASIRFSADRKRLFIQIDGFQQESCIHVQLPQELKNAEGQGLWRNQCWYSLQKIPSEAGPSF